MKKIYEKPSAELIEFEIMDRMMDVDMGYSDGYVDAGDEGEL